MLGVPSKYLPPMGFKIFGAAKIYNTLIKNVEIA